MSKRDPVRQAWLSMRYRCNNPNYRHFKNYGGRGISICPRWDSLSTFVADMGPRPSGCSLERIDNDGNYEPGNCRWATREEQNNNRRNNIAVEFRGETTTLSRAIRLSNSTVDHTVVCKRLRKGWDIERALTEPPPDPEELRRRQRISAAKTNAIRYGQ